MILERYIKQENSSIFQVSPRIVWVSSIFMGVLASVPKILKLQVSLSEILVDCAIAFLYSLYVWFYNLYTLPKFSNNAITTRFFGTRMVSSLLIGILIMSALVYLELWILNDPLIGSMILMYQFRGVLINLTIYMFIYLLYQSHTNHAIRIELERTKADHLSARYELLKQQVNPHFLFNSLNTLKSMVEIGDEHAADFIMKLADFYRFSLESRKDDSVPVRQELEVLESYFFLVQARFESGIAISVRLGDNISNAPIPTFTLQLLVENAIKHNIVSLDEQLLIEIYSEQNSIVIRNNLQPKNVPEPSTRLGLENIRQRFLHLTGTQIEVASDDRYFTVKLPYDEYFSHRG